MAEPLYSIGLTAKVLPASNAVAIGDALVYSSSAGVFVTATAAARAAADSRTAAIALTVRGGSAVGGATVTFQAAGPLAAEVSGLGPTTAGTYQLVRVSTAGRLERIASYTAGDDVVGYAYPDGRVALHIGLPWSLIAAMGGASTVAAAVGTSAKVTNVGSAYTVHGDKSVCTPEMFGAVGDGVTSDQTAFANAVAAMPGTYRTLRLGARSYLVTGITLPAGCSIIGQGIGVSTLKTTSSATVIQIGGEDTAVLNLSVEGNSAGAAQRGICDGDPAIAGSGHSRVLVDNVSLINLGADGFRYVQNPLVSGAVTYKGPTLNGVIADGCGTGFRFEQRGEYVLMVGCQAQRCSSWGVYMAAGNVAMVGGQLTYNQNGVRITDDVNGGHAHFSGVQINHNVNQAIVVDCSNSFVFNSCTVYGAGINTIELTSTARGTLFIGCRVVIKNWKFAAGVTGEAIDCIFTDEYAAVGYIDQQDSSSFRFVRPMSLTTGAVRSTIADTLSQPFSFAADANETLNARVALAEELIVGAGVTTAARTITSTLPPTKGNRISVVNNNAQNINYAWATGGSVTVPAGKRALIGADGTNARLLLLETASAGSANQIQGSDGAGGFIAPGPYVGAGYVSTISGTPTTNGFRMGNGSVLAVRNAAGNADLKLAYQNGANDVCFGENSAGQGSAYVRCPAGNGIYLSVAGGTTFAATGSLNSSANPIAFGAFPSTTGTIRLEYNNSICARNSGNTADITGLAFNSSETFIFTNSSYASQSPTGRMYAASDIYIGIGSTTYIALASGLIQSTQPRVGGGTPYASEGQATIAITTLGKTLVSSEYSRKMWKFTGSSGGSGTITVPTPANEDASYDKDVRNTSTTDLVFATALGVTATVHAGRAGRLAITPDGVFGFDYTTSATGSTVTGQA